MSGKAILRAPGHYGSKSTSLKKTTEWTNLPNVDACSTIDSYGIDQHDGTFTYLSGVNADDSIDMMGKFEKVTPLLKQDDIKLKPISLKELEREGYTLDQLREAFYSRGYLIPDHLKSLQTTTEYVKTHLKYFS